MSISSRLTSTCALVLVTCAFLLPASAVELKGTPEVTVTDTTATIKWATDVTAGTRLSYGLNEQLLAHRMEGEVGGQHAVQLKDLEPGTLYYFSFGTARVQLGTGKFTTTGTATKKTAAVAPPVAPLKKPTQTVPSKSASTAAPTVKKPLMERLFPKLSQGGTSVPVATAPPTRLTWGRLDSLQDHYERHGGDFGSKSEDDYAAQAWQFLQRAKRDGLPMKLDEADGSLRVFDPKTRAFASYDRRGKTRTYFKSSNPNYWSGQPGRPVTGAQLTF